MKVIGPLNGAPDTAGHKTSGQDPALTKAAGEFEAIFLNHLLSTMRSTVMKSSLFHGDGNKEEILNSMMDTELSKVLATGGGVGLANMLAEEMIKDMVRDKGPKPPGAGPSSIGKEGLSPSHGPKGPEKGAR